MTDIFSYLKQRPYPGRGILLGMTPAGRRVAAYFIMGRSENSRNRIFSETPDGIRTEAHDPSKMTDPSLIIYHPVRELDGLFIVTNGDQTDTIRDYIRDDGRPVDALNSRCFEPDGPNWTPRISGLIKPDNSYMLSILKSADGNPDCCQRFFFRYDKALAGTGHFISTYAGFGDPIPSFSGEPVCTALGEDDSPALAEKLWSSLDPDNRVSLYVNVGGAVTIINGKTL